MNITILTYILGFFVAILLGWITYIHIRMKRLFMGTKAKDLEQVMYALGKHTEQLEITQREINKHLEHLDNKMKKTIRNVETIRFNPFPDHGSNQSFAISFINDEGDGVVMSSLYARDRMSIFAKPVKGGKSDYELSEEEKEVLKKTQ